MTNAQLEQKLLQGEGLTCEFKKCSNGIHSDVYETVCAFLNRFGGDILLGIEDNGKVTGVPEKSAVELCRNFANTLNNPDLFKPVIYASTEIIKYQGKTVIQCIIPQSSQVHIFTERRVYKYITTDDLRIDMLPKIRQLAVNKWGTHPWQNLDDMQLFKSAGLYTRDYNTNNDGFTFAAILLLGKDEVIQDIFPAYRTDAICRRVNQERYDDRNVIMTNLVDSYSILMDFARKHLLDKFFLDSQGKNIS